ncbi:MAG TPA: methionine--tRNA ligase [Clostridia bacterium]|jgi:methionyl-tRNA synthetase|nr:MAG: Methionine--tRNA ligase [Firmicutes bacterium ADurb.Bin146]HOD92657.1 methionine--tRNA ligase [Clostridia bacterium]HQM39839.1 methionine--tRNA ligase [Clostridia bacterium]
MNKKKFYITTAIAYASGKPHIGNTYEIILADSIARFMRMQGYDVFFMTGTDEHGQKIEDKAKENNLTPKQFVDAAAKEIKRIWDLMNTSYDKFIRTTDEDHQLQIQKIFKRLYDKGDIYKSEYEGWYCTPCESFWTESQLEEGKCPDCKREVKRAKEEAYFFKLSKYQDRLMEYIEKNPDFIQPESRKNEMINNFLKPGLQDLCVSRTSFAWGVKVPFDPKHIVYVWIDALSNYITGIGYDADGNSSELYKKYWPCDVHVIGKDIVRFHTIYWPIMLMALEIPLPKKVLGHPWLLFGDGSKMSKSKGNILYADDLSRLFGVDEVRYYVLSEMNYANDGIISHRQIIEKINSDLANILGNLVNRTITMQHKYFDGIVRKPASLLPQNDADKELIELIEITPKKVADLMMQYKVSDAIYEVMSLAKRCNKYIDETLPWTLFKNPEDHERLKKVMYNLLEGIRVISILLYPFIPSTSEKITAQLNTKKNSYSSTGVFGKLEDEIELGKPEILFSRIDTEKKLEEIEKEIREKQEADNIVYIGIEDFAKIELKTAKIIAAEPVKGAKKLLKLQVDIENKTRQIISGIAEYYTCEELIGKTVIVVTNLKPAVLRGETSEGMLLAASDKKTLSLLTLDKNMPTGSKVS